MRDDDLGVARSIGDLIGAIILEDQEDGEYERNTAAIVSKSHAKPRSREGMRTTPQDQTQSPQTTASAADPNAA